MSNIKKNKCVQVKTKTGGSYSYTYTDLASINNYLDENNIKYYQEVESTEFGDYIKTIITEDGVEKAPRRGCKVISASTTSGGNVAQDYGAILTYCRRYSLLLALGLATDDNDANELTQGSYEIEDKKKITTKEEAEEYVLTFGKYSGKTLKELKEINGNYLDWLLENGREDIRQIVSLLIDEEMEQPISNGQKQQIEFMIEKGKTEDINKMYEYYKVSSIDELSFNQANEIIVKKNKESERVF